MFQWLHTASHVLPAHLLLPYGPTKHSLPHTVITLFISMDSKCPPHLGVHVCLFLFLKSEVKVQIGGEGLNLTLNTSVSRLCFNVVTDISNGEAARTLHKVVNTVS